MHGKLLCVVFLLHNTLLLLLSIGYIAVLMMFWQNHGILDLRYTTEERMGIVWPNVAAVVIALANGTNGCVSSKK